MSNIHISASLMSRYHLQSTEMNHPCAICWIPPGSVAACVKGRCTHIVECRGLHVSSTSPAPAVQWASLSTRVLFRRSFEAISSAQARSFPCQTYIAHIMCISGRYSHDVWKWLARGDAEPSDRQPTHPGDVSGSIEDADCEMFGEGVDGRTNIASFWGLTTASFLGYVERRR